MAESDVPAIDLAMAKSSKGNTVVVEAEEHESECSEEEGEIGESQALIRRSTRGRKSNREKRELPRVSFKAASQPLRSS